MINGCIIIKHWFHDLFTCYLSVCFSCVTWNSKGVSFSFSWTLFTIKEGENCWFLNILKGKKIPGWILMFNYKIFFYCCLDNFLVSSKGINKRSRPIINPWMIFQGFVVYSWMIFIVGKAQKMFFSEIQHIIESSISCDIKHWMSHWAIKKCWKTWLFRTDDFI